MKKKIFFLIIFFLPFFLGGCSAEKTDFFSNQPPAKPFPNIPSSWENYSNNKYQFSFAYPPDWELEIALDRPDFFKIVLKKEDPSQEKITLYREKTTPYYKIEIDVEDNPNNLSAKEKRLSAFSPSARKEEEEKIKEITVAGLRGIRFLEGAAPSSGPATMVLLSRNNKFYRFTYSALANKENQPKFINSFNLLLSSFKFN